MASIFDNARNLLKNLQTNAVNTVGQLIPTSTYTTDYRTTPAPVQTPNIIGSPSQMKLTINHPLLAQNPPPPIPTAPPVPQQPLSNSPVQVQQPNSWQSKYQNIYNKVLPQKKLTPQDVQVLVTSENGKENPTFQNYNYDSKGKPVSVDTGLLQINTPISAKEEQQKLKDPEYNIDKGLEILKQRQQILGDPVLAMASYNKGARGAILDPKDALRRAKAIFKNAGLPLPQTPFTQDPEGYVNQNRDRYKSMGLLAQGE